MLLLLLSLGLAAALPADAPPPLPSTGAAAPVAADTGFAATVARLSEPGGYFDTDNLISNEASYLHVAGRLRDLGVGGGAYLGVGPDQNFSYIAHVRPEIAFLVDIRRDNLLQHLLFKALFELSANRGEYLGSLLGRPGPGREAERQGVEAVVAHFDAAPLRPEYFEEVHARVRERLSRFGVPLSEEDLATIRRFHSTFAGEGLDLRFTSHGRAPQRYYPSLRQLILERDLGGRQASYLASEEDFQFVRSLQLRNRIVPVVGDLAGERALREIGRFLREREQRVLAVYTSNVEYYLAREGKLGAFVDNLSRLPLHPEGVIIRSVFRMYHPQTVPGYTSTQLLQRIEALVREHGAGRIRGYHDLVTVGALDLR